MAHVNELVLFLVGVCVIMVPTYHSLTRLKPAEKRESHYLGDEYQNFLIFIALIITSDEGGRWSHRRGENQALPI